MRQSGVLMHCRRVPNRFARQPDQNQRPAQGTESLRNSRLKASTFIPGKGTGRLTKTGITAVSRMQPAIELRQGILLRTFGT